MNTSIAVAPINAPNSSIVSLGPIQAVRKPPAQLHRGARHCAVQLAFRGAGQRMDRIVEACTRYRQTAPDRNRLRYVGLDRSDLRHRAACGLLLWWSSGLGHSEHTVAGACASTFHRRIGACCGCRRIGDRARGSRKCYRAGPRQLHVVHRQHVRFTTVRDGECR